MKKYIYGILGILIGFSLSLTVTTHADSINTLVGKIVQGEFPVTVNNVKLDKSAVVIDGTSYLPVRVIGSAIGYDITFNADLGVVLKKSEVVNKMSTTSATLTDSEIAKQQEDAMNQKIADKNATNNSLSSSKANLIVSMNLKKSEISEYQDKVNRYATADNEDSKKLYYLNSDFATWYKQFTDALTKAQSELAVLQTQYDSIQSQLDTLNAQTSTP